MKEQRTDDYNMKRQPGRTAAILAPALCAAAVLLLCMAACNPVFPFLDVISFAPPEPEQQTITITYADGAAGTMENANGEWVVTTGVRNMMIYSFTTDNEETGDPGQTYLMGRPDNDITPVKLKISSTGELAFRGADAKGIPVGTVAELQLINTALGDHYYQEADIDLLGGNNAAGTHQWTPIGKDAPWFTGVFDGNNKSLDYLYVNEISDGAGLFGYLSEYGALKNIRLKSGSVTGGGDDVGGIAGGQKPDNSQHIRISNCSNAATVTGAGKSIGGIIGWPRGGAVITGCGNSGKVSGNATVGGIAGGADANIIVIACYNTKEVSGNEAIGGIIGISGDGSFIIGCRNSGPVSSVGKSAGGISGGNDADITITACYNLGPVSGGENIAGIAGTNGRGAISACYNDGSITGGSINKGGIIGGGNAVITACYWNSSAPPTEAVHGIGWKNYGDSGEGTFDYSGSFPPVSPVSEWGTGNGPGWNGAGTPPVGGWWDQNTLGGGSTPLLWWE